MYSLINYTRNAINLGCASKHLIKSFKPWLIRTECTNRLSFLLFNFIFILHFVPLVTHWLPTLMHSQKMCIQLLYKILPICFSNFDYIHIISICKYLEEIEIMHFSTTCLHFLEVLDILGQY
jgi:hypothetical protein